VFYEPFGSFWAMKQKMDFYAANGVRGIFYCGVPTNFRDLFIYVQSHLLWNPKADVDDLVDEFMLAYYGKAAAAMREYFDFLASQVQDRKVHQMCEGANPGLVTAEFAARALAMFAKAEAAAARDRASLYRVRAEKFCVLFADLNERHPAAAKRAGSLPDFAARLAEFNRIARTLHVSALIRGENVSLDDWVERISTKAK
jgi:hypothetical protein